MHPLREDSLTRTALKTVTESIIINSNFANPAEVPHFHVSTLFPDFGIFQFYFLQQFEHTFYIPLWQFLLFSLATLFSSLALN
jgi:hypothetical protein